MIEYLQKFMLSSLMLYSIYYFFLRNDKTFRFNRFYLLLILPLSLTIPLITVQTSYIYIPIIPQNSADIPLEDTLLYHPMAPNDGQEQSITTEIVWNQILTYTYSLICLMFIGRFIINLYRLHQFKRQGQIIKLEGYQVCLKENLKSSFTFLSTIYTNKARYLAGLLPPAILEHEMAHVSQKHSYDIIVIELLSSILWFNPLVYMVKRSIKLNHEFLADEAACKNSSSLADYQKTLINCSKINSHNEPMLSSRLTFGETKKRLNMMVKTTHKTTQRLKQSLGLIAIATTVLAFGNQKVTAKELGSNLDLSQNQPYENSTLVDQKAVPINQLSTDTKVRFVQSDGETISKRLGDLEEEERIRFIDPLSKGEFFIEIAKTDQLSNSDWNLLLDKEKYGIWLNGDRVDNLKLLNYEPSDIYRFSMRKMTTYTSNLGNFEYQFFALTKEYVDKKYKIGNARGFWLNYNTYRRVAENIELVTQKKDTVPGGVRSIHLKPNILVRFLNKDGNTVEKIFRDLSQSELERFRQNEARPAYYSPRPAKMDIPENFANIFANENEYGIWLDGRRIKNSELKNYSASEIYSYRKSKLLANAKNYGVHTFQLNMYTTKYYEGKPDGHWINLLNLREIEEEAKNTP